MIADDPRVPEQIRTLSLSEAAALLGQNAIATAAEVEDVAQTLAKDGAETVVLTGGKGTGGLAQDCIVSDGRIVWLSSERVPVADPRGRSVFARAIAAATARGMATLDAIVVAKMFARQAMRGLAVPEAGAMFDGDEGWPECEEDLPWLSCTADEADDRRRFPPLDRAPGLYAIVDSAAWVERLAGSSAGALQLRVKSLEGAPLRHEIARAIDIAAAADVPLFVNDFWREAIEFGAFGVHLGQEDLDGADLDAIRAAGLRLGVSTHSYEEVARAHALRPSYLAIGPVFETKIKVMKFAPQGLDALARWRRTLRSYPLVAIGGIDESTIGTVAATGVDSVAVIRAITLAPDPREAVRRLEAARVQPRLSF